MYLSLYLSIHIYLSLFIYLCNYLNLSRYYYLGPSIPAWWSTWTPGPWWQCMYLSLFLSFHIYLSLFIYLCNYLIYLDITLSRPFYPGLVKYMNSGPVVAMCWEGLNAVKGNIQNNYGRWLFCYLLKKKSFRDWFLF